MNTDVMTSPLNVDAIRADFPILARKAASGADLIYLDNAASTQRPDQVIEAVNSFYREGYANVHRGIHTLSEEATAEYEAARQTVADFLGAGSSREIVFTAGCTAAINTVAHSWGVDNLGAGDVVLLPISEHHANIVPWQQVAARTGCRLQWLPVGDDYLIDSQVVADALETYQPKLFAFAAASNTLGTEYPVKRWTELGHQYGATVLVDAAQAVPHHTVNVRDWDADFVVFSGHKACGPTGIGVLYGKEKLLDAMPPFLGGGGMIHLVTCDGFQPARLPEKFEAGTPPIAQAVGLAAAIRYLQSIGLERIHRHEQQLCQIADEGLRQIDGLTVIGPAPQHKSGIVSFVVDGIHAHDLSQSLDLDGIAVRAGHHCTMPLHESLGLAQTCRASFYLYNSADEATRLIDAVKTTRNRFLNRTSRRRRV
ncbi:MULTISPECIES: aminotransferase class V-fold PLP-dependent enzyme [Crateriforma]|uniref:cysteine desulfurase n=1 Tax=Crateriforma conspicua TaxID=2527996 RepID=A0A5C6FYB3_9PLAN|nr:MULTISPECIES: SufS family cysteine desulfurase [Crateriforma]TWU66328.1 putative cysteine desulfurase [Crateriforma conspicua]